MKIDDPLDPTAKAVRAWIDEEGGPARAVGLPRLLRNEDFLHAMVSVDLRQALNRSSADNGGPESVHITRSPGIEAARSGSSLRRIVAVMVPAGTLARLQVMHRLLLGYWARGEASPTILASIRGRLFERHRRGALPLIDDLLPPAGAGAGDGRRAQRRDRARRGIRPGRRRAESPGAVAAAGPTSSRMSRATIPNYQARRRRGAGVRGRQRCRTAPGTRAPSCAAQWRTMPTVSRPTSSC